MHRSNLVLLRVAVGDNHDDTSGGWTCRSLPATPPVGLSASLSDPHDGAAFNRPIKETTSSPRHTKWRYGPPLFSSKPSARRSTSAAALRSASDMRSASTSSRKWAVAACSSSCFNPSTA